jgi:hypothetical protein
MARATFGSIQSALEMLMGGSGLCESRGTMHLWSERSSEMAAAIDTYQQVSSSALCFPGNIQGTLIMKARTISTDRQRVAMTRFAKTLQWFDRRRESAPAEGINSADMAAMDVNKNAERDRVHAGVYIKGSSPHRVWDRF